VQQLSDRQTKGARVHGVQALAGADSCRARRAQHPLKKVHFLVAKRDKGDLGAIGGAWEPSDGGHPEADPAALVATAVRTFKQATGVDLGRCTRWCARPRHSGSPVRNATRLQLNVGGAALSARPLDGGAAAERLVDSCLKRAPLRAQLLFGARLPTATRLRGCCALALARRPRLAEFSYLRMAKKSSDAAEHVERTVVFLVDAAEVAGRDASAEEALESARRIVAKVIDARTELEQAEAALKAAEEVRREGPEVASRSVTPWAAPDPVNGCQIGTKCPILHAK
jgi:DBC1